MRNNFTRWPASLLSLAFLCLCLSPLALAQQPTGGIEGSISDPQGAVVPNATVTAKSKSTNQTRTVNSNGEGQYQITQLPPDTYEVRVAATSFKTSVAKDVTVAVGT